MQKGTDMTIEERKQELKLGLADIRVEANQLINNIDTALSHLDEVQTEEDVKAFVEKYDVERGLKCIVLF